MECGLPVPEHLPVDEDGPVRDRVICRLYLAAVLGVVTVTTIICQAILRAIEEDYERRRDVRERYVEYEYPRDAAQAAVN